MNLRRRTGSGPQAESLPHPGWDKDRLRRLLCGAKGLRAAPIFLEFSHPLIGVLLGGYARGRLPLAAQQSAPVRACFPRFESCFCRSFDRVRMVTLPVSASNRNLIEISSR